MEEQEVYTVTIVRNIGIPISFTIKRWKVIFFVVFLGLLATLIVIGSVDYFFLRLESDELLTQLDQSQKKTELLSRI